MAVNPNIEPLGSSQIIKRQHDPSNDAQRVVIVGSTEIQMALSKVEDSVEASASQGVLTGTQLTTMVANDSILSGSCVGYNQFRLFAEGLTGLTVAGQMKVQISPYDSGTMFIDASVTLTSGAAGALAMTAISSIVARRIRVLNTVAPTGGDVTVTLVMSN